MKATLLLLAGAFLLLAASATAATAQVQDGIYTQILSALPEQGVDGPVQVTRAKFELRPEHRGGRLAASALAEVASAGYHLVDEEEAITCPAGVSRPQCRLADPHRVLVGLGAPNVSDREATVLVRVRQASGHARQPIHEQLFSVKLIRHEAGWQIESWTLVRES